MLVKKRDNTLEPLDITNIRKQTMPAVDGLRNISFEEIELTASISFVDGILSSDIQEALINATKSMIDVDRPDATFAAARLRLYSLYHTTKRAYGKEKQRGQVYDAVTLSDYLDLNKEVLSYDASIFDVERLNAHINPEHDKLLTSISIETLMSRYLIQKAGTIVELPQHMFMSLAMFLAQKEKDPNGWAIRFYDVFADLLALPGTPTLSNGRIKGRSCFSCFVGSTADDIESIFDTYKEQGLISKGGGGIGWDWTRIRAKGGVIQDIFNAAGGVVPWMKIENDIAIAVDQLGTRKGAINVYIETWHKDILDFLDLKKSSGEERRRAEDLFISVSESDLFMQRVENNEMFTLFDPYDVPQLAETFDGDFIDLYVKYEQEFLNGTRTFTNEPVQINAKDLMKKIISYYWERGQPFHYFKDTVNRDHRHPEEGIIRSSNLCTEILQPTDEFRTIVCNLASINLSKVNTKEKFAEVVPVVIRALDNVIDISSYPTEKSRQTHAHTRSIGLGIMGEAQLIAENHIMYGSEEHKKYIDELYYNLEQAALQASQDLAVEKGPWKVGKDKRNAYIMAIAPTSSIALIAGTTATHEPVFNRKWEEESMLGVSTVTAPNISPDTYEYYISAYDVDPKDMIDLTAIRQKYVDQAISHNMYFRPEQTTGAMVYEAIMYAWKKGLKTLYYLRSKSIKKVIKQSDLVACSGCE